MSDFTPVALTPEERERRQRELEEAQAQADAEAGVCIDCGS